MKKLGIVVLAVVLVAALALPPIFGTVTQRQVEARVAELSASGLLDAEMRSLDRGWFTSTARLDLTLGERTLERLAAAAEHAPEEETRTVLAFLRARLMRPVTVEVRMSHGPVMVEHGPRGGVSRMVARVDRETDGLEVLLDRLGIPYLFELRGHTGFDGVLRFDADVPPIDYRDAGGRLRSTGVWLEGSLRGQRLIAEVRTDALEAGAGPWRLDLEGLSASGDHVLLPQGFVLGTFTGELRRVAISNAALSPEPLFEAAAPRLLGSLSLNGNGTLVDAELQQRVDSLRAGTDFRLEDAAFGLSARNLDLRALQSYLAMSAHAALPFEPLVADVLAASPAVALDPVRFRFNGERFEASVTAAVQGSAVPPAGALDVSDRSLWTELLSGTASVRLSKALAEALAMELGRIQLRSTGQLSEEEIEDAVAAQASFVLLLMAAQGYVHEHDNEYAAEISYADGTLRLNDRALPLARMLR